MKEARINYLNILETQVLVSVLTHKAKCRKVIIEIGVPIRSPSIFYYCII